MLPLFPEIYHDELLYSVIARLKVRLAYMSPKNMTETVFGKGTARSIIDLPCNIEKLIQNIPAGLPYTVDRLVFDNTLYPFYAPFLKPAIASKLLLLMSGCNGGSINNLAGIMGSTIKKPSYLLYCPMCFGEDMRIYGESYWRRTHQAPGVMVCPEHEVFLMESRITVPLPNRHEYCQANAKVCCGGSGERQYIKKTTDFLVRLAKDVEWLLTHRIPSPNLDWFKGRYLCSLIDRGLATPTGRIDQGALKSGFLDMYGRELLRAVQSDVDKNGGWLERLVRKPRASTHPIRHLLLIRFLGYDLEQFFGSGITYLPFGSGPWPCLNGAADHYRELNVKTVTVSFCRDTKKPVGTFSCECGFVYSRRGPDSCLYDTYRIGRIKQFGCVWEEKLLTLKNLGLSNRAIANKLKVCTDTVIEHLLTLSGNTTESFTNESVSNDVRFQHRELWKKTQGEILGITKTQLRNKLPSCYTWLYRNDRDWLNNNSPHGNQAEKKRSRIDWAERDRQVFSELTGALDRIRMYEKPRRITINAIGTEIGFLAWLQKNFDKMPLTAGYLGQVLESVESFQIRRVQWVVQRMILAGEIIDKAKIERKAGLKHGYSLRVNEAIKRCLELYNQSEG